MTNFLVAPMEVHGYRLPESLMPDISQAKLLCRYLRDIVGIDTNSLPKYVHEFPDGRKVEANLYPVEHLATFRRLMAETWLPQSAEAYFKKRDPDALAALDKIMRLSAPLKARQLPAGKRPY